MADEILGTDLFGEPVLPRSEGRGRPEIVWDRETSNRVILSFVLGRSMKATARAVGLSVPTLRKVYFSECAKRAEAHGRMEILQLSRLNAQAESGKVAAEKELAKRIEKLRAQATSDDMVARQQRAAKAPKKGKKEQQRDAAAAVGGRFRTREAPSQLVN